MAVNYSLGSSLSSAGRARPSTSSGTSRGQFGRVVDVILDAFHPEYDKYGKSVGLYGVLYREVSGGTIEEEDSHIKFAYCGVSNIRTIPLKNEFVILKSLPSPEGRDGDAGSTRIYWTGIHYMWNHPHHNAYPDSLQVGEGEADLGDTFEEADKINTLQLFSGDTSIESRYGSSIRLGGTKGEGNNISTDKNNGKPYTIIRNGQHDDPADGDETILENINDDNSSIYLTSDHIIELEQSRDKYDALEKEPESSDVFEGAQIIMNSDRLFFNTKEEGIYFSSNEDFSVTAEQIGLDGDKYVALDARKIYLGKTALKKEDEPVLLGQSTVDLLSNLITSLDTLVKTMANTPPAPPVYCGTVSSIAKTIAPQLPTLKQQLTLLKSRKVFVE